MWRADRLNGLIVGRGKSQVDIEGRPGSAASLIPARSCRSPVARRCQATGEHPAVVSRLIPDFTWRALEPGHIRVPRCRTGSCRAPVSAVTGVARGSRDLWSGSRRHSVSLRACPADGYRRLRLSDAPSFSLPVETPTRHFSSQARFATSRFRSIRPNRRSPRREMTTSTVDTAATLGSA